MLMHHAQRKLTDSYRASAAHMDRYADSGFSFKEITSGKEYWDVSKSGDVEYDAGYTRYIRVRTGVPVTREQIASALHIYRSECCCEHDCCGHFNGGPHTHKLRNASRLRDGKARSWIFPVHYSPNL